MECQQKNCLVGGGGAYAPLNTPLLQFSLSVSYELLQKLINDLFVCLFYLGFLVCVRACVCVLSQLRKRFMTILVLVLFWYVIELVLKYIFSFSFG